VVHARPSAPLPPPEGSDGSGGFGASGGSGGLGGSGGCGGPERRSGARRMVDGAVAEFTDLHPGLAARGEPADGPAAEALRTAAASADLLVVGTRGLGGFPALRIGSVALELAGRAACPVALVPPGRGTGVRLPEVVLGMDARRPDPRAAALAFDAARRREARLRAVHAWSLPAPYDEPWTPYAAVEEDRAEWEDHEVQLLNDALRGWRERYPGVPVLADVRLLGAADALVRASARAAVLVVGRGREPGQCLGGVAHAVAHHAGCPILLATRPAMRDSTRRGSPGPGSSGPGSRSDAGDGSPAEP
jgi:nucleotide-binding universal stress UspA family protein